MYARKLFGAPNLRGTSDQIAIITLESSEIVMYRMHESIIPCVEDVQGWPVRNGNPITGMKCHFNWIIDYRATYVYGIGNKQIL